MSKDIQPLDAEVKDLSGSGQFEAELVAEQAQGRFGDLWFAR